MESPLISCIIPAYNSERYLREALDSLISQTYRPVELIVADDGSSDGTALLVANYGHTCLNPTRETAAACNLGPGAARGVVAFWAHNDPRKELLESRIAQKRNPAS